MIEFHEGDEVRLKNGKQGVLENINPNENYLEDDEIYAELYSRDSWGEVESPEDIVEVVRTAAQRAARTAPSTEEILEEIASSLHSGWGDVFDVYQTQVVNPFERDPYISVHSTTADGLALYFEVTLGIVEVDGD